MSCTPLNIHSELAVLLTYVYETVTKQFNRVAVKREVQAGDEIGIRVKEQSIIELGKLFAKTRQTQGDEFVLRCVIFY